MPTVGKHALGDTPFYSMYRLSNVLPGLALLPQIDTPDFFDADQWPPYNSAHRSISNPHVVYLRKLEREQIRVAIDALPELYREIIVLRDLEGFSYQEIATMLSCPAGTVMSRLGRARAKLRRSLASWQPRATATAV